MPTSNAEYRRALDEATREYEALLSQRVEIDRRIAQLAQLIGHLMRSCGFVPTVQWGLTDACRMVLRAAGHPLTAIEVRAQLTALGFDLSRYANELAAIHTVLKRLAAAGDVQFVARAWDKPAYQWQPAGPAAAARRAAPAAATPTRARNRKTK